MDRCRVEEETRDYLEAEAIREIMDEMFRHLEPQECVICEQLNHACDMSGDHPDICADCWADGELRDNGIFIDAGGHAHRA